MTKTKMARTRVNRKGREEWIFLNPTMGIYQSKKMKKKRMRQVTTSRPIKILFLGRFSNGILLWVQGFEWISEDHWNPGPIEPSPFVTFAY
jgi:hypothetical protein